MMAAVTAMETRAAGLDKARGDAAMQDTITQSCTYESKNAKMKATCPGFDTAQEMTGGIFELEHKHYNVGTALWFFGLQLSYELTKYAYDKGETTFKDVFCTGSAAWTYVNNTEYLATAWGWGYYLPTYCSGSHMPNTAAPCGPGAHPCPQ